MNAQRVGTGRARLCVVAAQPLAPLVRGPPPDYHHRVLRKGTEELVRSHPSLLPLVQDGEGRRRRRRCRCRLSRRYRAVPADATWHHRHAMQGRWWRWSAQQTMRSGAAMDTRSRSRFSWSAPPT